MRVGEQYIDEARKDAMKNRDNGETPGYVWRVIITLCNLADYYRKNCFLDQEDERQIIEDEK